MMNEYTTAGPAYCAAADPVSTKMPAPMIAPMPSRVRFSAPRLRFSVSLPSAPASCCRMAMLLSANSPPGCGWVDDAMELLHEGGSVGRGEPAAWGGDGARIRTGVSHVAAYGTAYNKTRGEEGEKR